MHVAVLFVTVMLINATMPEGFHLVDIHTTLLQFKPDVACSLTAKVVKTVHVLHTLFYLSREQLDF